MTREQFHQQLNAIKESSQLKDRGPAVLAAVTELMERVVQEAFAEARGDGNVAILATGGFGRRELHPHSDIDIIVLFGHPLQPQHEEFLKTFLHPLWDLGLTIGHHVLHSNHYDFNSRNLELATALLDTRLVAGNPDLFAQFKEQELPRMITRRRKEFLRALVASHNERHKRFNETIYQLEPDITYKQRFHNSRACPTWD